MDDAKVCTTCCEDFNTTIRRSLKCPLCKALICVKCMTNYTRLKGQVVCTSCNVPWDNEFVNQVMPRAFVTKEYKLVRQRVLFDREMELMPDTQVVAQAELLRRDMAQRISAAKVQKKNMLDKVASINTQIVEMEESYVQHATTVSGGSHVLPVAAVASQCPNDCCTGYLVLDTKDSSHLVCGMCDTHVCNACMEVTELGSEHTCTGDIVDSVVRIRNECRQCPKCSIMVYKTDGCDQMWCTQCHTAFSWNTGRQDHGPIHNPHWYEWQVSRHVGVEPTVENDLHDNIMLNEQIVPSLFSIPFAHRYIIWVPSVHRLLMHLVMHTLPRFMSEYSRVDNIDLRISYLLKEINEARMKKVLQQREKRRGKEIIIREVIASFVCIASDLLKRLKTIPPGQDVSSIHVELQNVRAAANEHLEKISATYVSKLYTIDASWCINDGLMVPSHANIATKTICTGI